MEAPKTAAPTPTPSLSAYIATAIREWSRRHGAKAADGRPIADTGIVLGALAETAGEIVRRMPQRQQRRATRSDFERAFRKASVPDA